MNTLHVYCSGDTNKVKLCAKEQMYARVFRLRCRRKFDEADKLDSLVDLLCNGVSFFCVLKKLLEIYSLAIVTQYSNIVY